MKFIIYFKIFIMSMSLAFNAVGADDSRRHGKKRKREESEGCVLSLLKKSNNSSQVVGENKSEYPLVRIDLDPKWTFKLLVQEADGQWVDFVHSCSKVISLLREGLNSNALFEQDGLKYLVNFPLRRVTIFDANGLITEVKNLKWQKTGIEEPNTRFSLRHSWNDILPEQLHALDLKEHIMLFEEKFFEVMPRSVEYEAVAGFIQGRNSTNFTIYSIKRVYNQILWREFNEYSEQVDLGEKFLLFCSANHRAPAEIFSGVGFDVSNTYFTDNLYYANLKPFVTGKKTNHNQILLTLCSFGHDIVYEKTPNGCNTYWPGKQSKIYPAYVIEFVDNSELKSAYNNIEADCRWPVFIASISGLLEGVKEEEINIFKNYIEKYARALKQKFPNEIPIEVINYTGFNDAQTQDERRFLLEYLVLLVFHSDNLRSDLSLPNLITNFYTPMMEKFNNQLDPVELGGWLATRVNIGERDIKNLQDWLIEDKANLLN